MSGIYLIVWNDNEKEHCPLLKTTKGGYPHITVAYTGDRISRQNLVSVAASIFKDLVLTDVKCGNAYINSFVMGNGQTRHDVLINVDVAESIERIRDQYLRNQFIGWEKFTMVKPHVTHGIYSSLEEATSVMEKLNNGHPSISATITGVTVD